jgi:MFS transporter, FHS family, glucose/mannose:H+ symporter
MLLFGITFITLGSVASNLQEKFQLDPIASGTLFSILPVGILIGSLLFGPFSDHYGYKIFLLLSCFCLFTGFQGIAYSPDLNFLKVCIFLFGFGGGAINGATNALVSDISKTDKGANLSLLGVFFGIGALGMPFILGVLEKQFSFQELVSFIGFLVVIAALLFIFTRFPAAKQKEGIPFEKGLDLLKNKMLLLIAFFLLCQSSFEGIINNWTTTYLMDQLSVSKTSALYALSIYVAGMTMMRLLIGSVFRKVSPSRIMLVSLALLGTGCILLNGATTDPVAIAGLILIGAGLAAGFPVMLGLVGIHFAQLSGTAFSLVLTVALAGNMAVNYLMGVIAEAYGIRHLTHVSFALFAIMIPLTLIIFKKK